MSQTVTLQLPDETLQFEAGMALFQAGKAPVLVCTGGWVPWSPGARPEGEILAERAVLLGVPCSHILVTDKVAHTADEARMVWGPLVPADGARVSARRGTLRQRLALQQ